MVWPNWTLRRDKNIEMTHQGSFARESVKANVDQRLTDSSVLMGGPMDLGDSVGEDSLADLRLDQVIKAVAGEDDERELISDMLSRTVKDAAAVRYRQEVFADLEDTRLFSPVEVFCAQMRQVLSHLRQLAKMRSRHQAAGWFLDAAVVYCEAVRSLAASLDNAPVTATALLAFRDYLTVYLASAEFAGLASETAGLRDELSRVMYLVKVRGPRIEVSRYDGEPDFSAEIEAAFERFRQGAVKDYQVTYRIWPGMTHLAERILDQVARLFSAEFGALSGYCERHSRFPDAKIVRFAREVRFYLAYLDYVRPLRSAGLSFCYPEVSASSKRIFARDTFDLALAARLARAGSRIVPNDFELTDAERVIVVTGPNQGGKTTFARTFGQLHHLAAVGCPVPGSAARLFLPDLVLTHFEREEDARNLIGKLEDDLLRIQKIFQAATPDSIVVLNEVFASTAASDAAFLGREVLAKIAELDLLCVYVTFLDELASYGDTVVSMVASVDPVDPAQRTYKLVRKPADGLAYALAIARKHQVTYDQLRRRAAR